MKNAFLLLLLLAADPASAQVKTAPEAATAGPALEAPAAPLTVQPLASPAPAALPPLQGSLAPLPGLGSAAQAAAPSANAPRSIHEPRPAAGRSDSAVLESAPRAGLVSKVAGVRERLAAQRGAGAGAETNARVLGRTFDLAEKPEPQEAGDVSAPRGPPVVSATGHAEASRALEFIHRLDKIRVYFAAAPGFGHQTATLSIVRRLRDLGYRGALEGIYDVPDNTPQKLGQLLPEFDPTRREDQHLPGLGLAMRSVPSFTASRDPVPLALTGGADVTMPFAHSFHADVFLRLGPFDWPHYPDELWLQGRDRPATLYQEGKPLFIYRPAPEAMNEALLSGLRPENTPPAKAAGLMTLLRRLEEHDVLAAYGLAFLDKFGLHRLALAVSRSMDERPELYGRRGVVIPLLLEASEKVEGLKRLVHLPGFDEYAFPQGREDAILSANEGLRRRFKTASIESPGLEATLKGLRKGDILFLETGAVPPSAFEWFFSRSTLPPMVEGKNAVNLARLMGLPFLPIRHDSMSELLGTARPPEVFGARGDKAFTVAEALAHEGGAYEFEIIADFISAAMTPGSPIRSMFEAGRISQEDYGRDKLLLAVDRAIAAAECWYSPFNAVKSLRAAGASAARALTTAFLPKSSPR